MRRQRTSSRGDGRASYPELKEVGAQSRRSTIEVVKPLWRPRAALAEGARTKDNSIGAGEGARHVARVPHLALENLEALEPVARLHVRIVLGLLRAREAAVFTTAVAELPRRPYAHAAVLCARFV